MPIDPNEHDSDSNIPIEDEDQPSIRPVIDNPSDPSQQDLRVAQMLEHTIDVPELASAVEAQESADAADTLEALSDTDAADVLGKMGIEPAAEALAEMVLPLAASVLSDLVSDNIAFAGAMLESMAPDDATDLLQELTPEEREALLNELPSVPEKALRELLYYDEESAGGMMTTEFLAVREEMTVGEATESIRRSAIDEDTQFTFVTDWQGRLRGTLNLRRLLIAGADELISTISDREVEAIPPELDREEVATEFEKYDFLVLPVVDEEDRLLGVVEVDDVIESIRAESTEDAQRMVGAGKEEAVYSTAAEKLRGRFPWLFVNLVTSSIAAIIVLQFEGLIGEIAILAVLMPVIANQAGNAGQQSLAVTLRGIVLDQIRPNRALPLVLREALVGAINGIIGGVIVAIVIGTVGSFFGETSWRLGVVAGLAMTVALAIGTLTGSSLPLLMRRLGFDPATASTIFLTMVTDSMSFFVFLGLASLLQSWLI
jgi:magnesium transporter